MVSPELLDALPFARALSTAARRELAARAVVREHAAGAALFHEGEETRGLHVVLEGQVRVLRGPPERLHVLHSEGPGGTLGEVPLFGGGSYLATAVASQPVRALFLDREAIRAAITADPELAWVLLSRLAQRVRALAGRLEAVSTRSVTARLAQHLLARATATRAASFTLGGSQAEVAEELGTVREVVVRSLRELRAQGALEASGGGRYRLLSRAVLEELAAVDRGGEEPAVTGAAPRSGSAR